jgi:cation/acetate symporter
MPMGDQLYWLATGVVAVVLAAVALLARSPAAKAHGTGGGATGPLSGGLAVAGLFAVVVSVLLPGLMHQHGFDALIVLIGLSGGLLLLVVLIGPALTRSGAVSVPDLMGQRFGRVALTMTLGLSLAATAGLLFAVLSVGVSLATRLFDVTVGVAALGFAAAILLIVVPGGWQSVLASSRVVAVLAGAVLLGPLALVCAALLGHPVVPLAYGEAVAAIGPAEMALIERGEVDFGVFKPYLREFLTVDRLNWALLTICLMGSIAALPPLVQSTGVFAPGSARRGLAWALTFVVIALTAVPVLAGIARLETYRAVAASQSFTDLPPWLRRASDAGGVLLHGTSLHLVDAVAGDVAGGATSIDAISATMADRGARAEAIWQRLEPSVQEAVLDLGRRFQASPGLSPEARWVPYVDTVVTAAAVAAGNTSGQPDLAAIAIDPQFLVLALPRAAGMPEAVAALTAAAVVGSAAVLAAALVAALSGMLVCDGTRAMFGREPRNGAEVALMRGAAVFLAIGFALAAALVAVPQEDVLVASLSLAAAGLLPSLILAMWCPRATSAGVIAAIVVGVTLGSYYLAGTAIYSVAFYEAWAGFSSAGADAFAEYEEARELWIAAAGDDRAAAYADLAARTQGSLWSPGLANWFGIAPAAAPVLAVPFAVLAGFMVSFVSGGRAGAGTGAPERSSLTDTVGS